MSPADPSPRPTAPPRLPTALVIAAVIMGPFMALQVGRAFEAGQLDFASLRLMGILWVLLASIVILAWGIVQRLRGEAAEDAAGVATAPRPLVIGPRLGLLVLAGGLWLGLLASRLPCLLGGASCE